MLPIISMGVFLSLIRKYMIKGMIRGAHVRDQRGMGSGDHTGSHDPAYEVEGQENTGKQGRRDLSEPEGLLPGFISL